MAVALGNLGQDTTFPTMVDLQPGAIGFSCVFRGELLSLDRPRVMGIVNCTPDSFFDGDPKARAEERVAHGVQLWEEGADILDLGGQSTRPGAAEVGADAEWDRVGPVLEGLCARIPGVRISIDTYHPSVAHRALDAGAGMVNDVRGLNHPAMWETLARHRASYVLMHMQGTPATMQQAPHYTSVVTDVYRDLGQSLMEARAAGVGDVVLDVGFGFGKTIAHNYELLRALPDFQLLGAPLLVGVSRKSMVYKPLQTGPEGALLGTTALHAWALDRGAHLLRVHDVAAAVQTITLFQQLRNPETGLN